MSSTVIQSSKASDNTHTCSKDLIGGETFQGRLELMQATLARVLRSRFREKHLNIMDIGIGDGAPTLIYDLPKILTEAGIDSATIIGVDLSKTRLEIANRFYEKAKLRGVIPQGVKLFFEHGDILAGKGSPLQLSAIAMRLKENGKISGVDLATSFNLLECPTHGIKTLSAVGEMAEALDTKGIGVIGNGQASGYDPKVCFTFKVFGAINPADNKITVNMGQDFLDAFEKLNFRDREKHLDQIAERILLAA